MIDDDNTQHITMSMQGPNGHHVTVSMSYSEAIAWPEIAKQFHSFLSALGYVLDPERVGVEY